MAAVLEKRVLAAQHACCSCKVSPTSVNAALHQQGNTGCPQGRWPF
jgi:hypothetical protein